MIQFHQIIPVALLDVRDVGGGLGFSKFLAGRGPLTYPPILGNLEGDLGNPEGDRFKLELVERYKFFINC